MNMVLVGIGAGLVSALLFAVVITGSPLGIMLSYAAPLPVFIAALGWRHRAGLVASVAGAVALALTLKASAGLAFLLGIALPAWWIAYLALLGRTTTSDTGTETTEWYPMGRVLLWIAITSAAVTLAGAIAIAGDHEAYARIMRNALELVLGGGRIPGTDSTNPVTPRSTEIEDLARMLAAIVPVVAGASFVPMIAANLWLAARTVKMSGLLVRPWPDMAATKMPRAAAGMFAASGLGYAVLPGFFGLGCAALFGALMTAFFMTGLAAIHAMTTGKPWRTAVLTALYFALVVILTLALPVLALFGLADTLFNLRSRADASISSPTN